jgi:hydroxypyruvate isomerase
MSTQKSLSRRSLLAAAAAGPALVSSTAQAAPKGRINQSVCKWCYKDSTLDELCANGKKMGIVAIDLLGEDEWPVVAKHGMVCAVGSGICSIKDGLNVEANHSQIEANFKKLLPAAKKAGVPNLICFSGNRRDISDEEAWDKCTLLLNKVKAQAEDLGVTIIMELLNSKVNHPDYQCDKTPWGVELCKRVDSPRFKLLYDIYHMQIMEGDVIRTIRDNIQYIGHFHTGGNPGRNEIDDTQELNYTAIAKAVADLKFEGYYAHEFIPLRDPMTSLKQAVDITIV